MLIIVMILSVAVLAGSGLVKRARDRGLLERHSITPDELHGLLATQRDLALFDVRLPLDLWRTPSSFQVQSESHPKK